jgi:two-component system sensor histidine kinase/response regulator
MVTAGHGAKQISLHVLVADDDFFMQRLAITLLSSLGHTGVVVADGEEVLAALEKRRFDVVLMDVVMPNMDGLQALASLRRKEQSSGQHQAVIMVTGHSEPTDRERLHAAGADGYICKPMGLDTLAQELQRVANL